MSIYAFAPILLAFIFAGWALICFDPKTRFPDELVTIAEAIKRANPWVETYKKPYVDQYLEDMAWFEVRMSMMTGIPKELL
jgi:hypothetical protein